MNEDEVEIYCPICLACGEDGCCPATRCRLHPSGLYCNHYLGILKDTYRATHRLLPELPDEVQEKWVDYIFEAENERK
jgi:hypothetical protein